MDEREESETEIGVVDDTPEKVTPEEPVAEESGGALIVVIAIVLVIIIAGIVVALFYRKKYEQKKINRLEQAKLTKPDEQDSEKITIIKQ